MIIEVRLFDKCIFWLMIFQLLTGNYPVSMHLFPNNRYSNKSIVATFFVNKGS